MFMVSTTTGTQGWAGERGQELKGDEMMKRAECQQEAEAATRAPALEARGTAGSVAARAPDRIRLYIAYPHSQCTLRMVA